MVANLPRSIGERELDFATQKLNWSPECFQILAANDSPGPGNIVLIELRSEHVREVFTGFGRQGARTSKSAPRLSTKSASTWLRTCPWESTSPTNSSYR